MEIYQKKSKHVIEELESSEEMGLSTSEANKRLAKYGRNQFTPPAKESIYAKIFSKLKEPLIVILLISGAISLLMGHMYDGIGIFAAVTIATTIAVVQEGKSDKAFEKLSQQSDNIRVKVLRDGKIGYIAKNEITVGDIVLLEMGDKVPADGRVIQSIGLRIDESMLTGEAEAISKTPDNISVNNVPLAERKNMAYGGTLVVEGRATVIVTSVGDNTEMGKIADELKEAINVETPLQEKLAKLGKNISIVGAIGAAIIFLFEVYHLYTSGHLGFEGVKDAFVVSIALIVAAVPEGLPTVVALTLAFNMQKMAKNQALVRKMIACETIGSINVICSDKTGTLTQNRMTVTDVWYNGKKTDVEKIDSVEMLHNFCINSTANVSQEKNGFEFVGNPTECSLLVCAKKSGENYENVRRDTKVVATYGFSSYRKMMSTAVENYEGYRLYTKGSPEKVLSLCTSVLHNDKIVDLNKEIRDEIESQISILQGQAKRIISFAYKDIVRAPNWENENEIEKDLTFVGFVGIEDPLRYDVKEAVLKCHRAGIHVKILTGDNINTARAIAQQLDIIKTDSIITEAEKIEKLSDQELRKILDRIVVIARSTPTTKMRIVRLLKEKNNSVAVTGDGINDAPALKSADVGVAMGIAGTEVSKEASDIVLLDDSFSTIVKSIKWGRGIYENFQRFLQFQLTVNVVAFTTAFLAEIFLFNFPFTTLQLLWVNIIMDGPPALSLGLEPPRDHLLDKQPVPRNASIVTKDMLFRIVTNGLFIVAALLLLMKTHILDGTEEQQSTIVFTTFVMFQLWNAFNCREFGTTSIFTNILKNRVMLLIILVTFMVQVAVTQFGGEIFKTVPLELEIWVHMIAYSFSVIIFSEAIKIAQLIGSTILGLIKSAIAKESEGLIN